MEYAEFEEIVNDISIMFFEPFGLKIYSTDKRIPFFIPTDETPVAIVAETFKEGIEEERITPYLFIKGKVLSLFDYLFNLITNNQIYQATIIELNLQVPFYVAPSLD
jgi:hypothetical protein